MCSFPRRNPPIGKKRFSGPFYPQARRNFFFENVRIKNDRIRKIFFRPKHQPSRTVPSSDEPQGRLSMIFNGTKNPPSALALAKTGSGMLILYF